MAPPSTPSRRSGRLERNCEPVPRAPFVSQAEASDIEDLPDEDVPKILPGEAQLLNEGIKNH
jgi:hypothetical protein